MIFFLSNTYRPNFKVGDVLDIRNLVGTYEGSHLVLVKINIMLN